MILFLQNLEPISFKRMDVIFGELESVDIIYFMMEGKVDIGYEINRKKKFRIRQKGAFHVGGFECCYKRRSQVIYRVSSSLVSGYFIRRRNIDILCEQSPGFFRVMRRKFLFNYIRTIRRTINVAKLDDIKMINDRADYTEALTLQADFDGDIQEIVNKEYERCFDLENTQSQLEALKHLEEKVEAYQA